jgi:ADP-ribose 1''-phosphate phosphatase
MHVILKECGVGALSLKEKYPANYNEYKNKCDRGLCNTGTARITAGGIICLFTSEGYGDNKASPKDILVNTDLAVDSMLWELEKLQIETIKIYSPKINSGLFRVPWEETSAIIERSVKEFNLNKKIEWTVWEL